LFRRNTPKAQQYVAKLETKHGKGTALTSLAHKLARAVYDLLKRDTGFAMEQFLHGSGSRAGAPDASLDTQGISLPGACSPSSLTASLNAQVRIGLASPSPARCLDARSGSCTSGASGTKVMCAAPPPSRTLTGEPDRLSQPFA